MTTRKPISLQKAEEKVRISLKKKDVKEAPTCAVGLALDVSGSMSNNYSSGMVSDVTTRMLALAKTFDDNGEMDVWYFNDHSEKLDNATAENYQTFVEDQIVHAGHLGGGTAYSPCLNNINNFYFPTDGNGRPVVSKTVEVKVPVGDKPGFFGRLFGGAKEQEYRFEKQTVLEAAPEGSELNPAFVIFLTDGENATSDISNADHVFNRSEKNPIFWLLVGVGRDTTKFDYLRNTAAKHSNVDYLQFDDLDIDDETLYDNAISTKFINWAESVKTA